jgi:hypothetical protein
MTNVRFGPRANIRECLVIAESNHSQKTNQAGDNTTCAGFAQCSCYRRSMGRNMFKRFCMMAVLTAVMCSGCLSRSKGPSTLPTTKLAAIAWIEFAGLTQDDLRERIGLARISQTLATAARIENGDIHSEVWALYFLRDACGEAPEGYNARPEVSQNNATLHLVNGHITRMHAPKLQAGPPADADNPFTITCHYLRSPTLGDSLNTGQTIGLLPLLPIFAVSKGVGDAAAERRYEAFSELQLGEPPPGGYNAWIRKHTSHFVAFSGGSETEIRFNTHDGKDKHRPPAATMRDGRIVTLNPGAPCVLRMNNSLAC